MKRCLFVFVLFVSICIHGQVEPYQVDSAFTDNIYWKRMQKLKTIIPLYFDEQVEAEIKSMLKDENTPLNLGKYFFYKDTITYIFGKNGLPGELSLIPFANTYFNPSYLSKDGESGIWALPYYVGKKYKIEINSYVDDRKDIIKSTYAASQSINDIYHIYRDWYFTIAGFRCGPVIINKAIRMAGNNLDYFSAEPFIDEQYRRAFSRFMASMYVVNYYALHQVKKEKFSWPLLDTIQTPRNFSLSTLATACKMPLADFRYLNAKFRKDIVPAEPERYSFVIPRDKKVNFYQFYKEILAKEELKRVNDSIIEAQQIIEKLRFDSFPFTIVQRDGKLMAIDSAGAEIDPDAPSNKPADVSHTQDRWVYYTVKSGDVLYLLEDIFDVPLNDIKKWNGLRSNTIGKGTRIKFLVPADKYAYYSSINRMTAAEKQKIRRKD